MRDREADRRLMRYLHGELPAAEVQELRAELARDPALQARLHELHRLWQGLKSAPPTPVPYGYVGKVQRLGEERQRRAASSALGWGAAPPWARALAGAALLGGVAIGVGLGRMQAPAGAGVSASSVVTAASPSIGAAVEPRGHAAIIAGGAPVQTIEGPAQSASAGEATPPSTQGSTGPTTPDPALESLLGASEEGSEDAASIGGGSTLAEAYAQALAGEDSGAGGGSDLSSGESGGLW